MIYAIPLAVIVTCDYIALCHGNDVILCCTWIGVCLSVAFSTYFTTLEITVSWAALCGMVRHAAS